MLIPPADLSVHNVDSLRIEDLAIDFPERQGYTKGRKYNESVKSCIRLCRPISRRLTAPVFKVHAVLFDQKILLQSRNSLVEDELFPSIIITRRLRKDL